MSSLAQIGQYRIESELGAGEWTETYHAYDVVLRRPVALKLLRPGKLPAEKKYLDFLAQAQRASDLVHPRIAWVWSTGETGGRYYLTERFVGGESLAARLKRTGPIPWDQALKTLEQIAQALEFGEEHGWIHGRATPHNILLGAEHGAVLSDYGLVNAVRRVLPNSPLNLYDAQYLPPENLEGQPLASRADQYALACTLVEILSGKRLFEAPSLAEMLLKKTTEIVQPLLPLESAPIQAGEVIEQALSPEPTARFGTALDFVSALGRAIRAGLTDTAARAQHEEQLKLWQEAEEKKRLEAEDTARMVALAQARREIQERAHLEAEQAVGSLPDASLPGGTLPGDTLPLNVPSVEALPADQPSSAAPPDGGLPPGPPTAETMPAEQPATAGRPPMARRPAARRSNLPRLWPLYTFVLVVVLGLGGYWLSHHGSIFLTPSPTPTASQTVQPAVIPPTLTASPSPSSTPTSTSTPSPSPTPTQTATRTPTPSLTPTITSTDTPRAKPTNTPVNRKERD